MVVAVAVAVAATVVALGIGSESCRNAWHSECLELSLSCGQPCAVVSAGRTFRESKAIVAIVTVARTLAPSQAVVRLSRCACFRTIHMIDYVGGSLD